MTTFVVKGTVLFTITLPLFPQVARPAMNLSLTLILKPVNAGQSLSSAPSRRQLGQRRCRERNHVLHNQTQLPASIALNQNSTKQHSFVEESRNLRLNIPECRYWRRAQIAIWCPSSPTAPIVTHYTYRNTIFSPLQAPVQPSLSS